MNTKLSRKSELREKTVTTQKKSIIKWSDNEPCIDVRRWRNGKPLKGIAFYPDEIDELIKLLKKAKKEVI